MIGCVFMNLRKKLLAPIEKIKKVAQRPMPAQKFAMWFMGLLVGFFLVWTLLVFVLDPYITAQSILDKSVVFAEDFDMEGLVAAMLKATTQYATKGRRDIDYFIFFGEENKDIINFLRSDPKRSVEYIVKKIK